MPELPSTRRYRFGVFEVDSSTGELRRQGVRIRLHAQPLQVLLLLLEQPGEMLTREAICRELWPDGTFVDYDHGVNSAVNRLREALGDRATSPRFVETLARRGYRFVAPVECLTPASSPSTGTSEELGEAAQQAEGDRESETTPFGRLLATPEDLPQTSRAVVQTLFLLLQIMYLGFYVGALANLTEINDLFSALPLATATLTVMIVTAAALIPVRIFLICAVLFHAPGFRKKFLKLWWVLLPLDCLWALAPFLLLHHMPFGLAVACMTPLLYAPFAQRSLILMNAGSRIE